MILNFLPLPAAWHEVIGPCWIMLAIQAPFEMFCEYSRSQLRPWYYMSLQLSHSTIATGLGAVPDRHWGRVVGPF